MNRASWVLAACELEAKAARERRRVRQLRAWEPVATALALLLFALAFAGCAPSCVVYQNQVQQAPCAAPQGDAK